MSFRSESNKRKAAPWRQSSDGKRRQPLLPSPHVKHRGEWNSRWGRRPNSCSWNNNPWRHQSRDLYQYRNVQHDTIHNNGVVNNDFDFADDNLQLQTEKINKIMATKKRLEEALASSKSQDKGNRDITSLTVPELSKSSSTNAKLPLVECQDFQLTNSDFKEIGSVDPSAAAGDMEVESSEVHATPGPSQQRSFDNSYSVTNHKAPTASKSPRLGGWSIDRLNQDSSRSPPKDTDKIVADRDDARLVENNTTRVRGKMFIQESRETILGPTIRQISDIGSEVPLITKPHSSLKQKQNYTEASRVGKLYQSFLKSRLSGYTPKIKGSTPRPIGANPLLDMSAILSSHNSSMIELEMPTVQVKSETNGATEDSSTAMEANEFCKEFGFLLSYPNFLISQDNLEKLGLGHLGEMNKMIDLSFTNHINGNLADADNLSEISSGDFTITNETNKNLDRSTLRQENSLSGENLGQSNLPSTSRCNITSGTENNLSVESIVKTVIENMTKSSGPNPHLPLDVFKIPNSSTQNTPKAERNSTSSNNMSSNASTSNKIEDISKKILNLFFIDKQIQELMDQKNRIYSELFSSKDISFTLFNNWAQDQVVQRRVLHSSNTSNRAPSNLSNENSEFNTSQNANSEGSFQDRTLYETMSELQSLKQEIKALKESSSSNCLEDNFAGVLNSDTQAYNCFQNDTAIPEKPKLSVRKDLVDPSLLQIPNSFSQVFSETIPIAEAEVRLPSTSAEETIEESDKSSKSEKKTVKNKCKKSKRNEDPEIIDLIEDSSSSDGPCDSSMNDNIDTSTAESDISNCMLPSSQPSTKIKTTDLKFDLRKNTATCITAFKAAVIVGCKEGFLMVFSVSNGKNAIASQIHEGAILSIHIMKSDQDYVVTGSEDSSICLFSLKEKVVKQKIKISSPIQCMDVYYKKIFIGTSSGFLFTCRLKNNPLSKSAENHKLVMRDDSVQVSSSNILALKAAKEGVRKVVIVAGRGENVTVRDSISGLVLRIFDWIDTVYCLETYNEMPLVFCGTSSQSVRIVNFITGENAHDCLLGKSIIQISFLDTIMFAASFDGQIYIYDVQEKRHIHTLKAFKNKCLITSVTVHRNKILVANNRDDVHALLFPAELKSHIMRKKKMVECES